MANASTNNAVYIKIDSTVVDSISNITVSIPTTMSDIMAIPSVANALFGYELRPSNTFGIFAWGSYFYTSDEEAELTFPESGWWNVDIFVIPPIKTFGAYVYFYIDGSWYDSKNPTETLQTSDITYPLTVFLPSAPSKTNFRFTGWRLREDGRLYTSNFSVDGTESPYPEYHADAEWERIPVDIALSTKITRNTITATITNTRAMPSDISYYWWQLYKETTQIKDEGGTSDTFHEFTDLDEGTRYEIKVGGYTSDGVLAAYIDNIFATTLSTNVWIYTSSGWKLATPYIYTSSGWKEAQAYVYTSSGWKES